MLVTDASAFFSTLRGIFKQIRTMEIDNSVMARERRREIWRQIAASYVALTLYSPQ
jgi:hypothetical protein